MNEGFISERRLVYVKHYDVFTLEPAPVPLTNAYKHIYEFCCRRVVG